MSSAVRWTPDQAERIVEAARRAGFAPLEDERLFLTKTGRSEVRKAMLR